MYRQVKGDGKNGNNNNDTNDDCGLPQQVNPRTVVSSSSDYKSAVTPRTIRPEENTNSAISDSSLPKTVLNKDTSKKNRKARVSTASLAHKKGPPRAENTPTADMVKSGSDFNNAASRAVALTLADSDAANESAKMAAMRPARLTVSHQLYHQPPGAHRVGGHEDDDIFEDDISTAEEQPASASHSLMSNMSPIAASIVRPEADIETQTQDIEKRVREEIRNSTTIAELVEISEEKAGNESSKRRQLWIIWAVLAIAGIIAVVVVLTGAGGQDGAESNRPTNTQCTLCFDGSEPEDLTPEVRRGASCADLQINLATLETAEDQVCKAGQATAWLFCTCPTLPPRPLSPVCSVDCPSDSRPDAFDSEVCRKFENFVEIVGLQESECAGLIELMPSECVCSPRVTDMRTILKSVSDEQDLLDTSTPQYMALEWLANKDPANLIMSETSVSVLQNRYFGALLWFNFGGENWDEQYSFKNESGVCDWNDGDFGIFCDDSGASLTKVIIDDNNLVGRFPGEFTKFNSLLTVSFPNNFISGTIPSHIGNMLSMEIFNLDYNEDFGGSLPSSLFKLQKLSELWLDECSLMGTLPENIGDAVSLTWLSMRQTGLTGKMPASILKASTLFALQLSRNELVGNLPNLDKMSEIYALDLSENSFWGTIPAHYGQLPSLEELILDQNFLTGTIPDLSGNTLLRDLFLYDNVLTGDIKGVFTTASATSLEEINLDNNELTGSVPTTIANFQKLDTVWLYRNKLTGTIPTELGLLTDLWFVIDLHKNMLNGTIPTELAMLTNLENLDVGDNQLTGPIPSVLGEMVALFIFNFAGNSLNGTIPTELGLLASLTALQLSNNQLTGTIPNTLGLATTLEFLDFSRNHLSSIIPTELAFLTNLSYLDLNSNTLNGTIPSEMADLRLMERISLADNKLTGVVPTEMALIPNLEIFAVETNQITGDLGQFFCERSSAIAIFSADCAGGGEVLCDCCSKCG